MVELLARCRMITIGAQIWHKLRWQPEFQLALASSTHTEGGQPWEVS